MSCTGIVRRILLSGSDRHYSTKLLRTSRGRVGRWAPTAATPGDFPRPPLQVPPLPLLPPPPIGSFDAAVAFACRDGSGVAVLGPSRSSGAAAELDGPLSLEARQLRRRLLRRTRPPKQPPPPPSKLDPPPALRAPWRRLGPPLPPRAHPAMGSLQEPILRFFQVGATRQPAGARARGQGRAVCYNNGGRRDGSGGLGGCSRAGRTVKLVDHGGP